MVYHWYICCLVSVHELRPGFNTIALVASFERQCFRVCWHHIHGECCKCQPNCKLPLNVRSAFIACLTQYSVMILILFKDHPLAFSSRNLPPEIKVSPKWVWHLLPLSAALLLGFHLAICSPSALALASTHTLLGRVTLNLQWLAPSRYIHCSKK